MTIPTERFNIGDEFAFTRNGHIKILILTRKTNAMLIMNDKSRWKFASYAGPDGTFYQSTATGKTNIGELTKCTQNQKDIAERQRLASDIKSANYSKMPYSLLLKIHREIGVFHQ